MNQEDHDNLADIRYEEKRDNAMTTYCAECITEEAMELVFDVPVCQSCYDQEFTPNLNDHAKLCKCERCKSND